MSLDCCFYLGLARPIFSNLFKRLSDEMVDLGVSVKRRMFKAISFRFNGMSSNVALETVPEEVCQVETKSHTHRPLPLPPVHDELKALPWYLNLNRPEAEVRLQHGIEGLFLVRPSSKDDTQLTLSLCHCGRTYNLPIRQRKDGLWALGTPKPDEENFRSIEKLVNYYRTHKIILVRNGQECGRVYLTHWPT